MPKHQRLHSPKPYLQAVALREFRSCSPVIDVQETQFQGHFLERTPICGKLDDYVSYPGEKDDFLETFELSKHFSPRW
jgi:hypothetical protein